MSATSFVLKGSGWYATDYAHSGARSKTDGETGASETKAGEHQGRRQQSQRRHGFEQRRLREERV